MQHICSATWKQWQVLQMQVALQISKKHKKKDSSPHLLWFVTKVIQMIYPHIWRWWKCWDHQGCLRRGGRFGGEVTQLSSAFWFLWWELFWICLAGTHCKPKVAHQPSLSCSTLSRLNLTIKPFFCSAGAVKVCLFDFCLFVCLFSCLLELLDLVTAKLDDQTILLLGRCRQSADIHLVSYSAHFQSSNGNPTRLLQQS